MYNTFYHCITVTLGGGYLVVGQEQDKRGGMFSFLETFVGSISGMNIWSRALNGMEVMSLATDCGQVDVIGDVIAWSDFLGGIHGDIQLTNTVLCQGKTVYQANHVIGSPHTCTYIGTHYTDCPELSNMTDGWVEMGSRQQGSVALYHCHPGHNVSGDDNRTCGMTSTWHGQQPTCNSKATNYINNYKLLQSCQYIIYYINQLYHV